VPNITPGGLDWSEVDIAAYLKSGFTPEFDSAGGEMAEVVQNMSNLPDDDLAAIAAYLKAVPPVEPPAN
jgi:cytochrome c553